MKVKELIEELKKFNPEAECYNIEGQVIDCVMYFEGYQEGNEGSLRDTDKVEIF